MNKVTLIHSTPDGDELIAYMARVSNPTNQANKDSSKLIRYLITHKHWSPFEMVNMCVEINTTRSISAQLLRHRSFSFQEFSQRYADVEELKPPTPPELRLQDPKNRQNSIEDPNLMNKEQLERMVEKPLKSLAKILEDEGNLDGIKLEIISSILKNIINNK